jgi:hypothetical protein
MNWPIVLLIGVAIGWLIELFVDYVYWRPRRICPETEQLNWLRSRHAEELSRYNEDVRRLESSIRLQEGELRERLAQNAQLEAKLSVLGESRVGISGLDRLVERMPTSWGSGGPITVNVGATQRDDLREIESHLSKKGLDLNTFSAAFFNSGLWDDWSGSTDFEAYLGALFASLKETPSFSDFDQIYGIGAELEDRLYEHGIFTYKQLVALTDDELIEILTRPKAPPITQDFLQELRVQAEYLIQGQYAELRAYQGHLRIKRAERRAKLEHIYGMDTKCEVEGKAQNPAEVLKDAGIETADELIEALEDGSQAADKEKLDRVLQCLQENYGSDSLEQVKQEVLIQARLLQRGSMQKLAGYTIKYKERLPSCKLEDLIGNARDREQLEFTKGEFTLGNLHERYQELAILEMSDETRSLLRALRKAEENQDFGAISRLLRLNRAGRSTELADAVTAILGA